MNLEYSSSLPNRIVWVTTWSKILLQKFNSTSSCRENWNALFLNKWYEKPQWYELPVKQLAKFVNLTKSSKWAAQLPEDDRAETLELGRGSNGAIYKVQLKEFPTYPLAIKRTNIMNPREVEYQIRASALAELGINPHFLMFYGHMHCKPLQLTQAIEKARQVEQQRSALEPTSPEALELQQQKMHLLQTCVATKQDVDEWTTTTKELSLQFKKAYGTNYQKVKNDPTFQRDQLLLHKARETLKLAKKAHKESTPDFELILMELAEGTFKRALIEHWNQPHAIVSYMFQTCVALVSLWTICGFSQNDLLLENIMYNKVDPAVHYVYQVGGVYFRVNLCGKLMKVIDFGLGSDSPNANWCVGGNGPAGAKPMNLQCAAPIRDVLELFQRVAEFYQEIGVSSPLRHWLDVCLQQLRNFGNNDGGGVHTLSSLVVAFFNPHTLYSFGLPTSTIELRDNDPWKPAEPFQLDTRMKPTRGGLFRVDDPTLYNQQIRTITKSKLVSVQLENF